MNSIQKVERTTKAPLPARSDKRLSKKGSFVLSSANTITDLFRNNALNYEVLKGDKKGISSVRINRQYRLEFTVRDVMNEQIVTVCRLLDISNHYK